MIVQLRIFREEHDRFLSNYLYFQQGGPETVERRNTIADTLGLAVADIWANASSTSTRMGRFHYRFFTESSLAEIGSPMQRELPVPVVGNLVGGSFMPELCVLLESRSPKFRTRISIPFVHQDFVTSTGKLATAGRVAWSAAAAFMGALDPVIVKPKRLEWEYVAQVFVSGELASHNHRKTHTPYGQVFDIEP